MSKASKSARLTRSIAPWRSILGYDVANLGFDEGLALLAKRIENKQYTPVTFLNAHNANVAASDASFADSLNAFLVLADGVGVDLASKKFHGHPFKANLNGTDLVPALFNYSIKPLKVALLGAKPEVIEKARALFAKQTPWHSFHIISDGYFKPDDLPALKQKLKSLRPDVLLVAMGVPRQEHFIMDNLSGEFCTMPMAIGALLDIHTGTIPRAPQWIRNMRLEWAYRLLREPRRLWYRYIVGNPLFLYNVWRSARANTSNDSGSPSEFQK